MKENTLFGTVDKVADSIKILKEFEPKEGYTVADSFGKDSCCIVELCIMSGVKCNYVHSLTTIDYPELVRFGKKHHKETQILRPKRSFLHEMDELYLSGDEGETITIIKDLLTRYRVLRGENKCVNF